MNIICSSDGKYRYWKEVRLSDQRGVCLFIMLNPATEDENVPKYHRTLEKCKKFAQRWGYGVLWTCNLFALRSPVPTKLKISSDPIGPDNDSYILKYARQANKIVCAWGNDGAYLGRGVQVVRMLEGSGFSHKIFDLGLTKKHQPKHPLFLSDSQEEFPIDIKLIDRPNGESLASASNRFLRYAEECLAEGNLASALENAWNAVEYYLKVEAESRNWRNRTLADLSAIEYDLAEETDDPEEIRLAFAALRGFVSASAMYGDWRSAYPVERRIKTAKSLIKSLENRTKPQPESRPSQKYRNGHMRGCGCDECRSLRTAMLKDIRKRRARRRITA